MKILRKANAAKMEVLGYQHPEPGITYVWNPALIREGNAVFNPLTEEAVILSDQPGITEKEKTDLLRGWYLVPHGFDLKTVAHQIRQRMIRAQIAPMAKTGYTIFTTTGCNACCEYCFEKDYERIDMTAETADKVAAYIIKTHSRNQVVIKWFGGEPLTNRKVITRICSRLEECGVAFVSEITTNGLLLPKCKDAELTAWHLRSVQLTLDDTGEEYERIKGLPAGAYNALLKSVDRLNGLGIRSTIRVHYHPAAGLEPCYRILEDLKNHEGVIMYARILYEEEQPEHYEKLLELESSMIQEGLMRPKFPPYSAGTHCMADRKNHATIGPAGDLSPCEHYAYGPEMYGTIFDTTTKSDVRARWAEREKHSKLECETCPLYAMCEKIVLCPAEGKCGSGYADYKISQIRRALRNAADKAEQKSRTASAMGAKEGKKADTGSGVVPCGVC